MIKHKLSVDNGSDNIMENFMISLAQLLATDDNLNLALLFTNK